MFRFTIRDVLWLMVAVALLLVMWRDRALLQNEHKAVQTKRRELDSQFLRLVNETEELHKSKVTAEEERRRFDKLIEDFKNQAPRSRYPLYFPPDPNAL